MHKIVISGGPSTGKSTTFEQLPDLYPGAHFVKEAAEQVIARELQKQVDDPTYEPVMPVERYREFAPLVIGQQVESEAAIPADTDLVFLDRSFIDNLGYLSHNDIDDFVPETERRIKAAKYTMAFFCDWLGTFERTAIRRETADEGLAIHNLLEEAYHSAGIPVVHLPAVSVESRIEIIRYSLDTLAS